MCIRDRDEAGAELRAMLAQRGIDGTHISIAAGRPTTVKLRVVALSLIHI